MERAHEPRDQDGKDNKNPRLWSNNVRRIAIALLTCVLMTSVEGRAQEECLLSEHATGGSLDLSWSPAFGLPDHIQAVTLTDTMPGYDNPSGDHTVVCLTNSAPELGGLGKSVTEPGGVADYVWEGYMFTGDANTRRGLVVRSGPDPDFTTCYQFTIEAGLLELRFRLLSGMGASTLGSWLTTSTPGGLPGVNEWHHMKISAVGDQFRVWWDGYELTQGTPIVDDTLADGWVGAYNFRFDLGNVPVYFDDLCLTPMASVAVETTTWSSVKGLYAK